MTISKQLSPVGYLNKMTGHIWTPTEQPNAADEPGLYEPLVLSREALAEVQQKDALQLSVDNILRGLGITGDGPFSQLVLDKFIAILAERDALAAENVALRKSHPQPFGPEMMKAIDAFDACAESVPEQGMLNAFFILRDSIKLTTEQADAAIAEIKAQGRVEGVIFTANRMLAAWESGFIDDTPAMALDISGAVLCALEFLPNADEGEFKRDYADEVRSRIAANLRAGRKG